MPEATEEEIKEIVKRMEEKEQERNPKLKKRVRGDALTRLCKASARTVRENSGAIVKSLYDGVLQGDVSCAKLLVVLIEKLPPPKPRSYQWKKILDLAKGPQWTGPLPSEMPGHENDDEPVY